MLDFLKISCYRLVSSTGGCGGVTEGREVDCQLSVWRPQDQLREIKEGTVMRFSGITANRPRYVFVMSICVCVCVCVCMRAACASIYNYVNCVYYPDVANYGTVVGSSQERGGPRGYS